MNCEKLTVISNLKNGGRTIEHRTAWVLRPLPLSSTPFRMLRALLLTSAFCISSPSVADTLQCSGFMPNWQAELTGDIATFTLRERTGDYEVKLTTPAQNDPDTTAYTLIGATDTAILIVHPGRCNTADHIAHVLTQERSEAILLTGCCRLPPE